MDNTNNINSLDKKDYIELLVKLFRKSCKKLNINKLTNLISNYLNNSEINYLVLYLEICKTVNTNIEISDIMQVIQILKDTRHKIMVQNSIKERIKYLNFHTHIDNEIINEEKAIIDANIKKISNRLHLTLSQPIFKYDILTKFSECAENKIITIEIPESTINREKILNRLQMTLLQTTYKSDILTNFSKYPIINYKIIMDNVIKELLEYTKLSVNSIEPIFYSPYIEYRNKLEIENTIQSSILTNNNNILSNNDFNYLIIKLNNMNNIINNKSISLKPIDNFKLFVHSKLSHVDSLKSINNTDISKTIGLRKYISQIRELPPKITKNLNIEFNIPEKSRKYKSYRVSKK